MSFEGIRGQAEALGQLESALSSGRMAHAVLLAGPDGVGKRKAALAVARALLCENGPVSACRRCPSCHRVEVGSHADLYLVEPLEKHTGITIDQVRDLSARLAESPFEGARKVAIVEEADSMTTQAQNCLLKTLEEPPADTTILLVAENTDRLLPTVRSRCRRVAFRPVADEIIAEFLIDRGLPEETARALAPAAGGSFSQAVLLAEDEAAGNRRRLVQSIVSLEPGGAQELAAMIAGDPAGGRISLKERRQSAAGLLGTLHSFLVDCLRVKAGGKVGTNLDLENEVHGFAGEREFEEMAELEKEVADAIILLGMYADIKLAVGRALGAFSRGRPARRD